MSLKLSLRSALYERAKLVEELSRKLGHERAERARSDYHARKPPAHCGATVHSVLGCTYQCSYCYLPDMGVSFSRAQPYALDGEGMALALASNPFFLPGPLGTYIALGSLGEPLHPAGVGRTLEHVEAFARLLRNPMQLSTKALVGEEVARRLGGVGGAPLNPLVTIVALRNWERLEPAAPPPSERLESISRLRRAGLFPMLFLRPLIPGLEGEAADLLREARRHGAEAVVLGGLRASRSILARLRGAGFDVEPILGRLRGQLNRGGQLGVPMRDVKEELAGEARRVGLVPLYSACCANTLNVYLRTGRRVPCAGLDFVSGELCTGCPVNCRGVRVEVDAEEVKWAAREFLGIDVRAVAESDYRLLLVVENAKSARRNLQRRRRYRLMLETAYRRRIDVAEV